MKAITAYIITALFAIFIVGTACLCRGELMAGSEWFLIPVVGAACVSAVEVKS
jgi:hypothetical protein